MTNQEGKMYYRFYPTVDGEEQGIGLFHVIDELDMSDEKKEKLLNDFDQLLPIPKYYDTNHGIKTEAYFTEYGLALFSESINKLIYEIEEHSIFMVEKKTLNDTDDFVILYEDPYQIIISKEK